MTPINVSTSMMKSPFMSVEAATILSDQGESEVIVLGAEDLQAFLNR